jgi:hypothetical protein
MGADGVPHQVNIDAEHPRFPIPPGAQFIPEPKRKWVTGEDGAHIMYMLMR